MSPRDEYDRQRDIEAEGQRAARPSRAEATPWYATLPPGELERRVAALPALLAVAKAADEDAEGGSVLRIDGALAALDAAHPDWRKWA